jgi:hypothetical protein
LSQYRFFADDNFAQHHLERRRGNPSARAQQRLDIGRRALSLIEVLCNRQGHVQAVRRDARFNPIARACAAIRSAVSTGGTTAKKKRS